MASSSSPFVLTLALALCLLAAAALADPDPKGGKAAIRAALRMARTQALRDRIARFRLEEGGGNRSGQSECNKLWQLLPINCDLFIRFVVHFQSVKTLSTRPASASDPRRRRLRRRPRRSCCRRTGCRRKGTRTSKVFGIFKYFEYSRNFPHYCNMHYLGVDENQVAVSCMYAGYSNFYVCEKQESS